MTADTDALATKNIRRSYGDGAAYSLMVGFGETYLPAFALAVGLSQVTAGLVSTLPLLFGGLLQLLAPRGVRLAGSYRRWVVLCASTQAAVYAPLAWAAWQGAVSVPILYALAAVYWGTGMAAGPVWNSWIDRIIPRGRFSDFLAVRSRLTQLAAFAAFLAAGVLLHFTKQHGLVRYAFTAIFAAAGLCRLLSVLCLARQTDAVDITPSLRRLPLTQVLARFRHPEHGRFLLFTLFFAVSVNVCSPFFSPYMLAQVPFSYAEYAALVSAAFMAKIAFMPLIARFVRRVGAYRVLWLMGLLVAPLPLSWFLTHDLATLLFIQAASGAAWGAFELASVQLIFDRIDNRERIQILTLFNLFNASAVCLGSVAGGWLLSAVPSDATYRTIFITSAVMRLLSLGVLVGMKQIKVRVRHLSFRTLALGPRGSMTQPILASGVSGNALRRLVASQAALHASPSDERERPLPQVAAAEQKAAS